MRVSHTVRVDNNYVQKRSAMLTSFQLYYFGNCISFIQFIFIINFLSLLGGRPMNAPTKLYLLAIFIKPNKNGWITFFVNPTVNFLFGNLKYELILCRHERLRRQVYTQNRGEYRLLCRTHQSQKQPVRSQH